MQSPRDPGSGRGGTVVSQSDQEELSHTALSSALQQKDTFYFVKAGGDLPIYDKNFRDFIDYGASATFGVGKKFNSNLTGTISIGVVMMTGKFNIKGDRQSIIAAAEEWTPGIISEPGQVTITPEDVPTENLGTGYNAGGEAIVTSSENLKNLDVDTTMYLFPVTVGAVYRFNEIGKVNPYLGGGIGYCLAERKTESRAVKEKYFEGPEYGIRINKSQTVNGMLVNFLAGVDIPFRKNMKFYAEANTSLYNLKDFDPILEVSFQKKSPAPFTGSDITTFSYEDPEKIGVFKYEFITGISAGLIIPF